MPDAIVEQPVALLRDLTPLRAVAVHDPEVVPPAAITGEEDPLAVGTKAGLDLVGKTTGDTDRVPPVDRKRVEVAEEVEDQAIA